MWKRNRRSNLPTAAAAGGAGASGEGPSVDSDRQAAAESPQAVDGVAGRPEMASIGRFVSIQGRISGSEDVLVDGTVAGTITLRDHLLTVGPHGRVQAEIVARAVTVMGRVTGNISTTDTITIRETGWVHGNLCAPRVAIVEGAQLNGTIDMGPAVTAVSERGRSSLSPGRVRAEARGGRAKPPSMSRQLRRADRLSGSRVR